MAKRYVTRTGENSERDITRLCNSGQFWSSRSKADAIRDIEAGIHEYWVNWANSPETKIRVVNGPNGKYLRTDRDNTTRNNLDDLPDCLNIDRSSGGGRREFGTVTSRRLAKWKAED